MGKRIKVYRTSDGALVYSATSRNRDEILEQAVKHWKETRKIGKYRVEVEGI